MSITSASILVDGTVATTGGTATTFIEKGQTLNQWEGILNNAAEFLLQQGLTFTIKDPKVNAGSPNGYTQKRSSIVLRVPLALDNSGYTVNTLKIELACDHETTAAEIESMLVTGAQLLHDSDFSNFWKKQSLS
jgi:hypothetical protein